MFGTYRTLLALMVVALHLGGAPVIGAYAVFGFYVLSGYLMTFIMQNNYGYKLAGITRYALNRFLRIYPMYWISIGVSVLVIFLVGETLSSGYHDAIVLPQNNTELIKNILLFFPNMDPPRLTPPAWALTVEIFFYILIGLGISKNKKYVFCWLAVSIFYHIIVWFAELGWEEKYFAIPAASLPFATGAFIYFFRRDILKRINTIIGKYHKLLPFVIFFSILANWTIGLYCNNLKGVFFYINYILCSLMVVALSDRKKLPLISKKIDDWIGNFSYPIYLVHYQVGLIVVFLLGIYGFDYKRPDLTIMLISLPLVFIAAFILTVTIERPISLVRAIVRQSINKINSSK